MENNFGSRIAILSGPFVMGIGVLLFAGSAFVRADLVEKWSSFAITVFTTGAGMSVPSLSGKKSDVSVDRVVVPNAQFTNTESAAAPPTVTAPPLRDALPNKNSASALPPPPQNSTPLDKPDLASLQALLKSQPLTSTSIDEDGWLKSGQASALKNEDGWLRPEQVAKLH
jgi:hypothetical protein